MDVDLDRRLRNSAPEASPLPGVASFRARVLSEAQRRTARRARTWVGSAAATLMLIGGGSVAVAGGNHMTPWGWFADNSATIERPGGADCFVGIRVQWEGVDESDPMVRDAKEILSAMDVTTLDISAQMDEDVALNETRPAAEKLTTDELRLMAMGTAASWETMEELIARGYEMRPGHEVVISADSTTCR